MLRTIKSVFARNKAAKARLAELDAKPRKPRKRLVLVTNGSD